MTTAARLARRDYEPFALYHYRRLDRVCTHRTVHYLDSLSRLGRFIGHAPSPCVLDGEDAESGPMDAQMPKILQSCFNALGRMPDPLQ